MDNVATLIHTEYRQDFLALDSRLALAQEALALGPEAVESLRDFPVLNAELSFVHDDKTWFARLRNG